MSSTALTIPSRALGSSAADLANYLGGASFSLPAVITQEPGPLAQFALALVYLRLAATLIVHGLSALPGHVNRAACGRLARIPQSHLLAVSASGLVGWATALCLTVMFIWR